MIDTGTQSKRVAILGGGMAALTAAYELTNTAGVDVTIHTLGWRLGGKCASSRGPHDRIEEHGIHGFLGSYYNANALLSDVYRELARPPGSPLASFSDAMVGMNSLQMYAHGGDPATQFNAVFPPNPVFPDPANPGRIIDCEALLEIALAALERIHGHYPAHPFASHLDELWSDVAGALAEAKRLGLAAGAHHPLLGVIVSSVERLRGVLPTIMTGLETIDPWFAQLVAIK